MLFKNFDKHLYNIAKEAEFLNTEMIKNFINESNEEFVSVNLRKNSSSKNQNE